jgi:hypothetical protein
MHTPGDDFVKKPEHVVSFLIISRQSEKKPVFVYCPAVYSSKLSRPILATRGLNLSTFIDMFTSCGRVFE